MKRYLVFGLLTVCVMASYSATAPRAEAGQPKKKMAVQVVEETKFNVKRHIHSLAFSPKGDLLAVGGEDVFLYDTSGAEPKELAVLKSRVGFGIHSMAFSPDGKYLALGGADHTVRLWDVGARQEVAKLKEHQGDVRSVAFSPDGTTLASGSDDKTTILWNVGSAGKLTEQTVIKAEDKFGSSVKAVVFTQKGKTLLLVTGCSNGTVRVFTLGAGGAKQAGGFKAKNGFGDVNMSSSPNGQLWLISDRKVVHMINSSGAAVGVLDGHKDTVTDVGFSPDGKLIATVGRDGSLLVWAVGVRGPRFTKDRPGKFTSLAWAPGSEGIATDFKLAAGLEDGTVWLFKLGYK